MNLTPEMLLSRVLFRDSFAIVLDKPCGIAVHGGPKGGVTLTDYLHHLQYGLPDVPQLAHRLDRETSGCLVLGRNKKALSKLGKIFENQRAHKTYHAVCMGTPPKTEGIIMHSLGRVADQDTPNAQALGTSDSAARSVEGAAQRGGGTPPSKTKNAQRSWWMQVDEENGQNAVTYYKVLRQEADWCLLELSPKTGRTHQLRVHCAAIGCHIAGDKVYGTDVAKAFAPRLMLHAKRIELPLHHDQQPICVDAPYPKEFETFAV